MTIEAILAIYVVGVVVTAVISGYTGDTLGDAVGPVLVWPIIVVVLVALAFLSAPHKLGALARRYLRSKTHG